MPRLTLRTLLAYIDDTLAPAEAKSLGRKVAESDEARDLVERIKKVTRRRGLKTPVPAGAGDATADPNTVAEYLDNTLDSAAVTQVEETSLASDVHLAEVAAVHQILTLVLTEPVRVPPRAHRRMYGLVPPPAGRPRRRPNKKVLLPVSGSAPPAADRADADDADAALLLGMKRYSAAGGRVALAGIGLALAVLLAVAVFMAMPHPGPKPPEVSPGHSFAQAVPPPLFDPGFVPAKPKDAELPKRPAEPEPAAKGDDPAPVAAAVGAAAAGAAAGVIGDDPGPNLADPVAPPDPVVADVGRVETDHVLVVAQKPGAPGQWVRLKAKPDDDPVMTNTAVMALPGYKAVLAVGRDRAVQVLLWGNVPEQLPYRVFESKVTFHPPAPGFDADLTLNDGRIYLHSRKLGADKKAAPAKVRVRLPGEVWDVTLPNDQAEVLVELVSWFEPGTAYARDGGPAAKREGRVAVLSGSAGLASPRRFRTLPKLDAGVQLAWDSATGALGEPKPIGPPQDTLPAPPAETPGQKVLGKVLTDAADRATDKGTVRQVLEARLEPPPAADHRDLIARTAVYALTSLADSSPAGGDVLKALVDELKSELPWPVRQSVVTALTHWVARDRGNTAILRAVLVGKGLGEDTDAEDAADRLLRLLRGFANPMRPDAARLDELAKLLEDRAIPVREAALWHVAAAEQEAWIPAPVVVNVGAVGAAVNSDEYKRFLAVARGRIEAVKKRQVPVPLPRPVGKDPK